MWRKSSLFSDLVDVIYPEACVGCHTPLVKNEDLICTACLTNLPRTGFELLPDNPLIRFFVGRCKFEKAASFLFFEKGGSTQNLLHALKYQGRDEVGKRLGHLAAKALDKTPFLNSIDVVVPVPLHPRKLAKRGYNQSAVIGQPIAEAHQLHFDDTHLIRSSFSSTQTRKSRFARWLNVKDIFEITNPAAFKNKHVLLIDDVVTTGSTVEACAIKLAAQKGCKVSLFTAAIAL